MKAVRCPLRSEPANKQACDQGQSNLETRSAALLKGMMIAATPEECSIRLLVEHAVSIALRHLPGRASVWLAPGHRNACNGAITLAA
jgi:hypothetical protein